MLDDIRNSYERAVLILVVRDGQILLMRKKRGLGAGKVTGPGGRVEHGESTLAAARRELMEELGVVAIDVRACGVLDFKFNDGYALWVVVFKADDLDGEPAETEEGIPMWRSVDALPWDEMWEDDPIWMSYMLAGTPFFGRFRFDGDRMVEHAMSIGADAFAEGMRLEP